MQKRIAGMVVMAFAVSLLGVSLRAQTPPKTTTTITVPDMHCGGCAKKVTDKLKELQGVAELKADLEAKTVTVTPKTDTTLSPKSLWEAVEKAGKHPTQMEGPSGKFTEKPKA